MGAMLGGIWVAIILAGSLVLYLPPQEIIQEDKSCVKQEVRNDN